MAHEQWLLAHQGTHSSGVALWALGNSEVGIMSKMIWASLLALPMLALGQSQASAGGGCWTIQGGFKLKICATGYFNVRSDCCNGGCGSGGYCGNDGQGGVPGPWYLYWPQGGQQVMTAPGNYQGWTYDQHFQAPAPSFPFWGGNQFTQNQGGGYQPANYYPSYWYNR